MEITIVTTSFEVEQSKELVSELETLNKPYNYTISMHVNGEYKAAYFASDSPIEFRMNGTTLESKCDVQYNHLTHNGDLMRSHAHTIGIFYPYVNDVNTDYPVYLRNSLYAIDTKVSNLNAIFEDNSVKLSWINLINDDVAGLVIKRCENHTVDADHSDCDIIFNTTDTSICKYVDTNIKTDRTYNYTVYLHNAEGEFYDGETISIITTPLENMFPKRFTTCDNIGSTYPTSSDLIAYDDTPLQDLVTIDNGKQTYIVKKRGEYAITAAGARGGAGNGDKSIASCKGGLGAKLTGTIKLNENDKLEILVGQRGTDNPGTSGDGTTGAGGGGTFVVYHPYNILTSAYDEPILLIAAAAGNGGRDYGYNGDGAVYHGQATTPSSPPSLGSNNGGGYDTSGTTTSCGKSYIQGGFAATDVYSRYSKSSEPGFGGGGSNKDDGEGGGGGGYYGGHLTSSAYSYINEELFTDIERISGENYDNGYVELEQLTLSGYFMKNTYDEILYYDEVEANWVKLEGDLTENVIRDLSLSELPIELTNLVDNGTIIKCTTSLVDEIQYTVVALPLTNVIEQKTDVDLTNKVLVGVDIEGTNEVNVLVSCNNGYDWMYYNEGNWITYNDDHIGMSIETTNSIGKNIWSELNYNETNCIRFAFIINSTDYSNKTKVNSLKVKTIDI